MKLVTIIIPIYNGERYIERCLNSLCNQNYDNIEILLINDGSRDGTEDICLSWSKKDKRISYIYQNNGGVSSARNRGLQAARGDYICFVDVDDYVDEDYVYHLVSLMDHDVDMAVSGYVIVDHEGRQIELSADIKKIVNNQQAVRLATAKNKGFQGYPVNKLFSRKIIEDNNIRFDRDIHNLEDLLFVCTYLKYCNNVNIDMKRTYHYVRNESSIRTRLRTSNVFDLKWLSEITALDRIVDLYNSTRDYCYLKAIRALSAIVYLKKMDYCQYEDAAMHRRLQNYVRKDLLWILFYGQGDIKWILSGLPYCISLKLGKLIENRKNK